MCAAVQERKHDEPQRVGVACSVSLSALGWLLIRSAQSAGEERTKEERSEARRKTQELLRGDGSSVEEATQAHRREWHGLSRSFGGNGNVLVGGKIAPIVGPVSMDIITVQVGKTPCRVGDPVTIVSAVEESGIGAFDCAQKIGTVHYELLTRLNPLIERLVV